ADPHPLDDVGHTGGGEAAFSEQAHRRGQDLVAGPSPLLLTDAHMANLTVTVDKWRGGCYCYSDCKKEGQRGRGRGSSSRFGAGSSETTRGAGPRGGPRPLGTQRPVGHVGLPALRLVVPHLGGVGADGRGPAPRPASPLVRSGSGRRHRRLLCRLPPWPRRRQL